MSAREQILSGTTSLGIELGSTRIKACLIGENPSEVLAVGGHVWENKLEDGYWTYSLEDVWQGVQAAYADLLVNLERDHGAVPREFGAIGVSAMMHGYLPFDASGELLVPFRTWRNTTTGPAASELSEAFGVNIPLRWSVAHLRQAVIDAEQHIAEIDFVTTLAGYVHWRLTGQRVLGIGDASGVFPINDTTRGYDADMLATFDALNAGAIRPAKELLPEILIAGNAAGRLTPEGAALLDLSGVLQPGAVFAPPEGDAGTGMVATCSVAPRTGNVSAGTSIFAMVVLDRPLAQAHAELDLVTTPAGDPVAMVHCNNGASELGAWAGLFERFAAAAGAPLAADAVFETLLSEALEGAADAGGLLAYNHLAGEPIAGLTAGRPLVVRAPDSEFTLANFMRAQVYGVFGTLALGMRTLHDEGVTLDRMFAHGGLFRTAGVAQRFLAAALNTPVALAETASVGGSWGIAVLAAFTAARQAGTGRNLDTYLHEHVFAGSGFHTREPHPEDVAGFAHYLDRYRAGLAVEQAAVSAL